MLVPRNPLPCRQDAVSGQLTFVRFSLLWLDPGSCVSMVVRASSTLDRYLFIVRARTRADTVDHIPSDVCEALYLRWNRLIMAFILGILVVE
jgi:hypothetical protein